MVLTKDSIHLNQLSGIIKWQYPSHQDSTISRQGICDE